MANKLIHNFFHLVYKIGCPSPLQEDEGIKSIIDFLSADKPCMLSRFGSTELQALSYEKFRPFLYPLKSRTYHNIQYASGFFPVNKETVKLFYQLYEQDVAELDALITWRFEEMFFKSWIGDIPRISKNTLDGFYNQVSPWTQVLAGKKIVVVHPFAETIERQYEQNRTKLFENQLVLPMFSKLETVKAVQSIAGNAVDFSNWFDALDFMKNEIQKKDFDIALLGCGAYGMPLAAHVKRMGKKAVHMGGILQFLFGIKGKRYIDDPKTNIFINEYFVSPDDADRPTHAEIVEGGCYW